MMITMTFTGPANRLELSIGPGQHAGKAWRRMTALARSAACLCLFFASLMMAAGPASADELIELALGHSQLMRPDANVGTLIVGNPAVADAALADGNLVVLTAHRLGTTNLIILDEDHDEIASATLSVVPVDQRPRHTMRVLQAGQARYFLCGPGAGCAEVGELTAIAGACRHPDDIAPDGRRCGDRAARTATAPADAADADVVEEDQ